MSVCSFATALFASRPTKIFLGNKVKRGAENDQEAEGKSLVVKHLQKYQRSSVAVLLLPHSC